uniref:Bestrophin homolog n=1 Tax=Prymnesium polylepis TaxID=72548 RepID=A0A7S4MFR3_9EUKA
MRKSAQSVPSFWGPDVKKKLLKAAVTIQEPPGASSKPSHSTQNNTSAPSFQGGAVNFKDARSEMSFKVREPLREIDASDTRPYLNDRWLNLESMEEAAAGFFSYDPSQWMPTLKVRFTPFIFYPWLFITATGFFVTWMAMTEPAWMKYCAFSDDAHLMMGTFVSFLVVFRTNMSHDRWWEARCSWQTVISTCRTLGAMLMPSMSTEEHREEVAMMLMAFVISLKAFVREEAISEDDLGPRMNKQHIAMLNRSSSPPLMALRYLLQRARLNLPQHSEEGAKRGGKTSLDERLISVLIDETSQLTRVLAREHGTMERIKSTPMVFAYVCSMRFFLLIWLVTFPITLPGSYGWLAPVIQSAIAYLFLNIEQMCIEIEGPFGRDPNDLPLEDWLLMLERVLMGMRAHNLKNTRASRAARLAGTLGRNSVLGRA